MAVPASGSVSISDIRSAFPNINSNKLGDYKGVKWYKSDNSRGYFASGSNAYISMSAFRDTRYNSPVNPGGFTITSSQSWQIPLFNKLYVTLKAGDGGKSGDYGINGCYGNQLTPSSSGGSGTASSFGGYSSASGGAGGSGNGVFGAAGSTVNFTWDADANNSLLSHQYETVYLTVGTGGNGGSGGPNYGIIYGACYPLGNSSSGSAGAGGYISISWT